MIGRSEIEKFQRARSIRAAPTTTSRVPSRSSHVRLTHTECQPHPLDDLLISPAPRPELHGKGMCLVTEEAESASRCGVKYLPGSHPQHRIQSQAVRRLDIVTLWIRASENVQLQAMHGRKRAGQRSSKHEPLPQSLAGHCSNYLRGKANCYRPSRLLSRPGGPSTREQRFRH